MTIRDAKLDDAAFIAKVIMAGMHFYDFEPEMNEEQKAICSNCLLVASREDTIYSYKHTRIAEDNGETIGALVSYPGEIYHDGRRHTFSLLSADLMEALEGWEEETGPGEYYLDSLAVLPEWRCKGIGSTLIKDSIDKGFRMGFDKVTLVIDSEMPDLRSLYESIGFIATGTVHTYGVEFTKMGIGRQNMGTGPAQEI